MSKLNDITGQRFGRLTAVSFDRVKYANRMQVLWACKCDCGNTVLAASSPLKRGAVKSCGCWNIEETVNRTRTHGMRHTPTYSTWVAMRARCERPNNVAYPNYGGRGITVCGRWKTFAVFLADMGERPSIHHQLDRIDNNGHYTPENCRWSDRVQQGANKRNNVLITANGETLTCAQWARKLGISYAVVKRRHDLGWPHDRIVNTPVRR